MPNVVEHCDPGTAPAKLLTFPRLRAAPVREQSFLDVPRRAANVRPGDRAPPDSLLIPGRRSAHLPSKPRRFSSRRRKFLHDHTAVGPLSFSPAVTVSCIRPRRCDRKPCSVAHPAIPAFDIRCVESRESYRSEAPTVRSPTAIPVDDRSGSGTYANSGSARTGGDAGGVFTERRSRAAVTAPGQDCAGLRSVQFNERSDGCNSPTWRGLRSGWVS